MEEAEHLVAKSLELEPRVRFWARNEGRILEADGRSDVAALGPTLAPTFSIARVRPRRRRRRR